MLPRALSIAGSVGVTLAASVAFAQSDHDFYAGKTVKIVIGTSVGGDYGQYAQLVAQHIGKFVPGKPAVIVQSMPGAGGVTALRYLAKIAPQDGTVLSVPHTLIVQDGLLNPNAQFDPGAFQWIGRLTTSVQAGVASSKSNVQSLTDAKTRTLVAGGTAPNNQTALNPRILNALAGTRFKIVTGYKGMGAAMIAWERGEIDVIAVSWDLIKARYNDKLRTGLAVPLYVNALRRAAELPHVPVMTEFGRTEADKAFLQIYGIGPSIGRSLAAPPGVSAERVQIWRAAFAKMLDDPEFKQAVAKGNIRLEPLDGAALAASVGAVVSLPRDTIAQAAAFYERLLAKVR